MTASALIPCQDPKRLQQAATLLLLIAAVLGSRPAPAQPVKPPRAANLPTELSAPVPGAGAQGLGQTPDPDCLTGQPGTPGDL